MKARYDVTHPGSSRSDIRVAGREIYTRDYEWQFLPRNLMYERNR